MGGPVIKLGKPVYRPALRRLLTEDVAFTAFQDRWLGLNKLKKANEEIEKRLGELRSLAELRIGSRLPREIDWKVEKVLRRLQVLEADVDRWEVAVEEAKRRLKG